MISINDSPKKKYVIFGAGNYIGQIFDLIHRNNGVVSKIFLNMPVNLRGSSLYQKVELLDESVKIYDSLDEFVPNEEDYYVLGFTTVEKYELVKELKKIYGIRFSQLIDPEVKLGSNVHLGEGVLVASGVNIGADCYLGDFCSVIEGAIVGHDSKVGKYSIIGPFALLSGHSQIGRKTWIAARTSILDGICVGDSSIVGAHSLVNKDIPEGVVAYGVPAKVVRENE